MSLSSLTRLVRRARRPEPPAEPGAKKLLSPLTLRVLAVNMTALGVLAAGLLYIDRYQQALVRAEVAALQTHAALIAGSLGEGATEIDDSGDAHLSVVPANAMARRVTDPTRARLQLYDADAGVIFDSALARAADGRVTVRPLPSTAEDDDDPLRRAVARLHDAVFNTLPRRDDFPHYPLDGAADALLEEARDALAGEPAAGVYLAADGRLVFAAAAPVQRYRKVVGALALSRSSEMVDVALRRVRLDVLSLFALALALTVLSSLYLAWTIAQPIRRLAAAADRLRGAARPGAVAAAEIPDLSARGDEIGDLSLALRAMTQALADRLQAIEHFAADVSHELKNPLASLRSAVESAATTQDPDRRARLTALMRDDVRRMDRLLTDIAGASRLDAELARAELEPLDLGRAAQALAEVRADVRADAEERGEPAPPPLTVTCGPGPLVALAVEDRLMQVLLNLISNADSFSPPGGGLRMSVDRMGGEIRLVLDDDGPGFPPGREEDVFDRFYSERPSGEAFGLHSGLGLTLCRQILHAHRGSIRAETRRAPDGAPLGARLTVTLPAAR